MLPLKHYLLAGLVALALLPALFFAGVAASEDNSLPLGDGRVSSVSPARDSVFACVVPGGGGGAFRDGPWIDGDVWYPGQKIAVRGNVSWPSSFRASQSNGRRKLSGNNLPSHPTGVFPIASDDPAYQYDRNPNSIRSQSLLFSISSSPKRLASPRCLPMGAIGVARNGVKIFNALDGEGRDAVAHEIQDSCQGHPERSGAYHYHSLSSCLQDSGQGHSSLIGWALDGFPLYGLRGPGGVEMTNATLDVCHGHTHKIVWNGRKRKMYHYHATREYPYTLGCFRGAPVPNGETVPPPPPGS